MRQKKRKQQNQRGQDGSWYQGGALYFCQSYPKPEQGCRKFDLKLELLDFKNFINDIKQEFNTSNTAINQKLQSVVGDVRNHGTRLTKVEQRVEEIETAITELRDTLLYSLKQNSSS